jgi:DNA polymerase III epsilon subunit-like protein
MSAPAIGRVRLARGVRFAVLDVETTPSDTGEHVVSVGLVHWTTRGPSASHEWFADPGVPIENERYHGINDAMAAGKPPFAALIPALNAQLRAVRGVPVVLVAHNAIFDVGVLTLEYQRTGATFPDLAVLDTLALARHLGIPSRLKLRYLLRHFGITQIVEHDALEGARVTAALLSRLLALAAAAGYTDLQQLLTAAQPDRTRTTDYPARAAERGTTGTSRSPFVHIDRTEAHGHTHKRLPAHPSSEALDAWLDATRECVRLRCPMLPARAGQPHTAAPAVVEALLADLRQHLTDGSVINAATTLGVLTQILPTYLQSKTVDAAAFYDQHQPLFAAIGRCVTMPVVGRVDACPDCRADRACPADVWPQAVAAGALGNASAKTTRPWVAPNGRIAGHAAAGRRDLAAALARLIAGLLQETKPAAAVDVADLAASLGLIDPQLVHLHAHQIADDGHPLAALTFIDQTLAHRNQSTDRAWTDLGAFRDALAAHQAAARRARPARPRRPGHSAPADRPSRRRFTP